MKNKIIKIAKYGFLTIAIIFVVIVGVLYFNYGGGEEYPDISTSPVLASNDLEMFFSFDEPIGNVAATNDTSKVQRVFFTVHPESRPEKLKLLEIVNGKAIPYPSLEDQSNLFNTPLGVFCDNQNRLWIIDHGNHGTDDVNLFSFNLETNSLIIKYTFPSDVAQLGSFLNDLTVTPDGRYVFVADVSFWRQNPALVVYDIELNKSRRLLEDHPSVVNEGFVPVTPSKKMRFFGILDLMPGIDGLDVSHDGKYVYYAAMSHSGLYRIAVNDCINFNAADESINSKVEYVAKKPLSDGIRLDNSGNVYITDVEHEGIYIVYADGRGETLIRDQRIRWADGLSLGGGGYFYLADSDIPDQMLQSKEHIKEHSPYNIFRFRPVR